MIGHDLVNAFIVFYLRSLGKIILFSIGKPLHPRFGTLTDDWC